MVRCPLRPSPALLACVVGLCASATGQFALGSGGWSSSVLCAVSEDGLSEAWIRAQDGLVLFGWPAPGADPLALGRAGLPRFLPDGRFVFETSEDDGHRVLWRAVMVLDPGATVPREAFPGEPVGRWVAPTGLARGTGGVKVCVDAGHGGSDPGAVGNGLLEKDVNLDVSLRLADWLATDNGDTAGGGAWDVLLTRVDDSDVSLLERVTMANAFGAASFLSIHSNAFTSPAANGTETYAWAEGTVAAQLRDRVHARMLQAWNLTDRGTKTAGFYVLLNTTMPASLSEMGFVTSPVDAVLLGDPDARRTMALAHLFALQEHHGFDIHEPSLFTLLGGGTYGFQGKPSLFGYGPLTAGSQLTMQVINGAPNAFAILFLSFASTPAPFLGGALHAFPVDAQFLLTTDAAGAIGGSTTWPPGMPSGTQVWYQVGIVDGTVPAGATLTDGLVSTTP